MHILGKVLTWLVMPLAVVAVVLSARILDIQNSWTHKVEQLKDQNQKQAKVLVQRQEALHDLKEKIALSTMGWEGYWGSPVQGRGVNVRVQQSGEISAANIGKIHGIVEKTAKDDTGADVTFLPMLHAFRPDAAQQGSYIYVGAFQVNDLRENEIASMVPTWEVRRPGEPQQWPSSGDWHFRAEIPLSSKTRIDSLLARFVGNVRLINDNNRNLQAEEVLLKDAGEKLDYRRGQLVGPKDPPNEPTLAPEFVKGLVPAIEIVEEQRNLAQSDVDRLRRLVKLTKDELERLNRENVVLAKSLTTTTPASAVSAR